MFAEWINETAADCDGKGIWYPLWDKEIAWIIVIIYAIIVATNFFVKAKNVSDSNSFQSEIFRGYGFFVIGYIIARIFFILSDIERWNNCQTVLHVQYVLFSYTVGIFSALSLLSIMEKHVMHMEKRILTKTYLVLAIIALIIAIFASLVIEYLDLIRLINTIVSSIGAGLLMILYIRVIYLSTGEIRKQAFLIFLGIALIFVGSIIDSELVIRTLDIPIWIPAILPFTGFTITLITMKRLGVT